MIIKLGASVARKSIDSTTAAIKTTQFRTFLRITSNRQVRGTGQRIKISRDGLSVG